MLGKRMLSWTAGALLVAGCGGGTARVRAGASVDGKSASATTSTTASGDAKAGAKHGEAEAPAEKEAEASPESPEAPRAPAYDPTLVRQALDLSAADPSDGRTRLGLRLAVVEQGPDRPWLVALVNRGTAPVRVVFDLRTLSLEVTPKAAEPDPKAKRAQPKAPKPVACALPKDVVPKSEQRDLEVELPPGEALVDSFDPRLYCMPKDGVTPLAAGATVVARLGWSEKTKDVWRKGKKERVVVEQVAPFLARLPSAAPSMPKAGEAPPPPEPPRPAAASSEGGAPESDRFAVKQLVAPAVSLGDAYAEEPERESKQPLAVVVNGSDASTEREATVTVAIVNRGDQSYDVHFRREYVSFEVSGPSGFVACEPGPDERAPDRALLSRLRPGGRLAAKSRLIELCPAGALRAPGLYLVHARFDSVPGGSASEAKPFRGRVVSRKPATVRVRRGWGALSGQHAPLRVRVGSAAPE